MKYQAYPEYKDSGVEWLGELPEHWDVKKLKFIANVQPSNVDKKTNDGENSVLLCNYTDVYYNDSVNANMEFMKASATEEQIKKFTLRAGDTIITKDSEDPNDIAIPTYVPEDMAGVICGYHLSIIRPNDKVYGAYIKRVFECDYARAYFATRSNGLTRYGLGTYPLDNVFYPKPPEMEAANIANFLDHETAKIDTLIEKQQQLIKLLKEKRQAVISHAVIKGLNPNAPMHDSGVEWLGEVPKHWDVKAMKYAVILQRGHDLPSDSRVGGEIPIVSSGGFIGYHSEAITSAPTIVTGRYGTIGEFVYVEQNCWPLNTSLYAVEMYDNLPKFLWYMLQAYKEHFVLNSLKAAVPGVDRNDIHPIKITIPYVDEQMKIVAFLDSENTKLDILINKASSAIELMQERRTALISAAVTGKIDVRNYPATGV